MKKSISSVRWNIVALLAGFSFVSYVERMNISVAAKFMMPAFSLTQVQMGQVFSSFLLGYALFQVPAGYLGDRYGPRLILTMAALTWAVTTLLTGLLPGLVVGGTLGVLVTLVVVRFLLGVGEAATYPVAARAIASWIPASEWAFSNAIVVAGLSAGSAVTPPLISWLMIHVGWRASFYVSSVLALMVAICWMQYSTDHPRKHPRISQRELSLILSGQPDQSPIPAKSPSWVNLLRDRNLLLISLSYFFDGYVLYIFVFWLYTYLVDVRGFSILGGGIFASLPFIVSSVLTVTGGVLCDWLSARVGRRWGCRAIAITGFSLSAIFLFLSAGVRNPYIAIAGLALSVGFVQFTEGAFWSAAISVSGVHAGAATGIMNMLGNLGGAASTAMVPILVQHFGWIFALGSGSALAAIGGILWLGIQADRPLELAEKTG